MAAGLPLPVPPELRSLAAAYAEQLPRSYLYSGFTTVIDLAAFDRAFLDRFKAAPLHPDSYDCGGALALANGYPMAMLPKEVRWDVFPNFLWDPRQQDSIPGRFRPGDHTPQATVARVAADGGICVKTFEERGFGPAKNLPTPTLAMIRRRGSGEPCAWPPVLIHANSLAAWRFAVQARVDVIAHGMWNWDEFEQTGEALPAPIRALLDTVAARADRLHAHAPRDRGVGRHVRSRVSRRPAPGPRAPAVADRLVPDARRAGVRGRDAPRLRKASDARIREIFRGVAEHGAAATRYLVSRGGRLVFGSDTPSGPTYGNPPGLNGFLELERLAAAGVPLPRLLEAATIEAARAFHLDRLYGTIEAGKVANLVLLRASPLETAEAYDAIDLVVVRGQVLDRSVLAAR